MSDVRFRISVIRKFISLMRMLMTGRKMDSKQVRAPTYGIWGRLKRGEAAPQVESNVESGEGRGRPGCREVVEIKPRGREEVTQAERLKRPGDGVLGYMARLRVELE